MKRPNLDNRAYMQLLVAVFAAIAAVCFTNSVKAGDDEAWAHTALERLKNPPLGLPPVVLPGNKLPTAKQISLGRKLFFDRRLSHNNTMSCGMCHIAAQGFTNNELNTPIGVEGRSLKRNAPTTFNIAYHRTMFHDGRDTSLETQVFGPFLAANEMANPSIGWLLQTISGLEDYWGQFEAAYGEKPNMTNLGHALASYQRTVLSANSRFDRWLFGGDKAALNKAETKGYRLFRGKAGCTRCHKIGKTSALFTDHRFHNTGVGARRQETIGKSRPDVVVELAPGITTNLPQSQIDPITEGEEPDRGRMEVTEKPSDLNRFKTPMLRNVALTAPYMHDGRLQTLKDVIAFYNKGPAKGLPKLNLSEPEQAALVAFLKSLTGDNVAELIKEADGSNR